MFVLWICSIQQHARNRLRGLVLVSILLPLLSIILALIEYYLTHPLLVENIYYVDLIGNGRLYSGLLFDLWQLWSYVFFYDGVWHFLLNMLFLLPLLFFWERRFRSWFPLALLLLLPVSVFTLVLLPLYLTHFDLGILPDLGSSPLIMALAGGLLFHEHPMRAELILLRWWGTRISVRRQPILLWWVLLGFAFCDFMRVALLTQDLALLGMYALNALMACCAGTSVFSLLELAQGYWRRASAEHR